MAPRRGRKKVGLTRMHAALDAMGPMGFSPVSVRQCVKNLLKVYGDDGWAFLEDCGYKLLIDTMLDEPEVPRLEYAPVKLALEGGTTGHVIVPQLCDKGVVLEEKVCALEFHDDVTVNSGRGEIQEQDLAIVSAAPMPLQEYISDQFKTGLELSPASSPTCLQPIVSTPTGHNSRPCYGWISDAEDFPCPQPMDSIPTGCKPKSCYGWISDDDEDDEFLHLIPANSSIDN